MGTFPRPVMFIPSQVPFIFNLMSPFPFRKPSVAEARSNWGMRICRSGPSSVILPSPSKYLPWLMPFNLRINMHLPSHSPSSHTLERGLRPLRVKSSPCIRKAALQGEKSFKKSSALRERRPEGAQDEISFGRDLKSTSLAVSSILPVPDFPSMCPLSEKAPPPKEPSISSLTVSPSA